MKKTVLVSAALMLLSAPAFADNAGEITGAITEATAASTTGDMEGIQAHLHRAANCLVNSSSGSYVQNVGNPCDGQGDGAIEDTTLPLQKMKLQSALTSLGAGCNQTDIRAAQRYAREAIKTLNQAKAMKE